MTEIRDCQDGKSGEQETSGDALVTVSGRVQAFNRERRSGQQMDSGGRLSCGSGERSPPPAPGFFI